MPCMWVYIASWHHHHVIPCW